MLADAITDIHARSRGTYGILRLKAALEIEQGLIVNTKLRCPPEPGLLTQQSYQLGIIASG
jgi:hypothetical protein